MALSSIQSPKTEATTGFTPIFPHNPTVTKSYLLPNVSVSYLHSICTVTTFFQVLISHMNYPHFLIGPHVQIHLLYFIIHIAIKLISLKKYSSLPSSTFHFLRFQLPVVNQSPKILNAKFQK